MFISNFSNLKLKLRNDGDETHSNLIIGVFQSPLNFLNATIVKKCPSMFSGISNFLNRDGRTIANSSLRRIICLKKIIVRLKIHSITLQTYHYTILCVYVFYSTDRELDSQWKLGSSQHRWKWVSKLMEFLPL